MISLRQANHFFAAFVSSLGKAGVPIIILFFSANRLSINDFSTVAFGMLLFNLTSLIVDMGYQIRLPKVIARSGSNWSSWFGSTLAGKLVVSGIYGCLLIPVLSLGLGRIESRVSIACLVAGLMFAISLHFLYVLRGLFKFSKEASAIAITELLTLIVVFVYSGKDWTAESVAFSFLAAKASQMIIISAIVWPVARPKNIVFRLDEVWAAMPYTVQTLVGAGFLLFDGLIVKIYVSNLDFGLHQMFVRLVVVACFILGPMQIVLISYFSKITTSNPDRLKGYVWRSAALLSSLCAISLACYWIFDDQIVANTLGQDFNSLTNFTWLLVSVTFLRYVCIPFAIFLSVSDGQVVRAKILAGAFLLLLFLNFVLVPEAGIKGSFYASLISHSVLLFSYIAMATRGLRRIQTDSVN